MKQNHQDGLWKLLCQTRKKIRIGLLQLRRKNLATRTKNRMMIMGKNLKKSMAKILLYHLELKMIHHFPQIKILWSKNLQIFKINPKSTQKLKRCLKTWVSCKSTSRCSRHRFSSWRTQIPTFKLTSRRFWPRRKLRPSRCTTFRTCSNTCSRSLVCSWIPSTRRHSRGSLFISTLTPIVVCIVTQARLTTEK